MNKPHLYAAPQHAHLATLKSAARQLAACSDFSDALAGTIAACLPALGDFGFFDVRVGDQVVRTVRAHDDERTEALLRPTQWVRQESGELNLCALSSGRAALHTHLDDAWYCRIAANEGHLALLRQLGFRSMITVPMRCGDELVGALTLFMGRSGRQHDADALDLASDLAALAAPVVVNKRLLEAERRARAEAETARQRLEALAAAGARFSRSLDPAETIEAIASLIVPRIADWCRIDVIGPDGRPHVALVRHDDEALARRAFALAQRWRAPASVPGTIDWVIEHRRPHMGSVSSERLELITDPEVATMVRETKVRDSLMVPLVARGRILGAIAALQAESGRHFDEQDLGFFTELAQRAALAIDNARLYSEAETARRDAERANRTKDEFLAVLGHELRNPLAPIVTSLKLMELQRGKDTPREREIISRQVAHLSRLVDDLLDVSRITQNRVELQFETLDLREVVSTAVESVSGSLHAQGIDCMLSLPAQPVPVRADAIRMNQVLSNLLINARKFTGQGGHVTTSLAVADGQAEIAVADSGIGIAPELLPHVFELFTQGPQSIARQHGGLGLGLAIARSLVALHGGTIEARSAGTGRGSTFVVRLPLAQPRAEAQSAPATAAAAPAAQGRLLVVDDNADARETLAMLLEASGYEVQTAANATAALEVAERIRPELALLDIGLPGMDGYALAARLRATPQLQPLRLVALTGYGSESAAARAREAGFDEHLVKPTEPDLLMQTLQRLLQR